jgi:nucleoid-associated protein YgaU
MRARPFLLVLATVATLVLAGCARQGAAPSAAGEDSAIAEAKAEEAKAKAAEAKAKAAEAAARADKVKADAKRARSDAARAAKAAAGSAGSSGGSSYSSPSVWISCNRYNTSLNVYFGGDWHVSTSTASLLIDYGDGRHYTTSHIPYFRSAYRHTYASSGDFLVSIRLTDGRGNVASDSCMTSVGWD